MPGHSSQVAKGEVYPLGETDCLAQELLAGEAELHLGVHLGPRGWRCKSGFCQGGVRMSQSQRRRL